MIRDVMVRLDGTSGDDARLAAPSQIAEIFEGHIAGLFFNVLPPPPIAVNLNGSDASQAGRLLGGRHRSHCVSAPDAVATADQSASFRRNLATSKSLKPLCLWPAPPIPSWRSGLPTDRTNRKA
jgi:hypothetical protein